MAASWLGALEDRRVEGFLGQRKRAGRNRRQLSRDLHRAIHQHARRTLLIDQAHRLCFVDEHGAAGEDEIAQGAIGNTRRHDLKRQGGEGNADGELGDADAAVAFRHDAVIARRCEDAAAGDRVTVDRRDQRLWQRQRGAQEAVEDRQEAARRIPGRP